MEERKVGSVAIDDKRLCERWLQAVLVMSPTRPRDHGCVLGAGDQPLSKAESGEPHSKGRRSPSGLQYRGETDMNELTLTGIEAKEQQTQKSGQGVERQRTRNRRAGLKTGEHAQNARE